MPAGSDHPSTGEDAHAKLGCRTCDTTYEVPHDETLRLRLLAFFDEHVSGHQPWIDLSAAGPIQLPEPRAAQDESAGR